MTKTTLPSRPIVDEKHTVSVIDISSDSDEAKNNGVAPPAKEPEHVTVSREESPESSWEIESLYEDILDEIEEYQPQGGN